MNRDDIYLSFLFSGIRARIQKNIEVDSESFEMPFVHINDKDGYDKYKKIENKNREIVTKKIETITDAYYAYIKAMLIEYNNNMKKEADKIMKGKK